MALSQGIKKTALASALQTEIDEKISQVSGGTEDNIATLDASGNVQDGGAAISELQAVSEKDAADGYAGLDGSGKLDPSVLPAGIGAQNYKVVQVLAADITAKKFGIAAKGHNEPASASNFVMLYQGAVMIDGSDFDLTGVGSTAEVDWSSGNMDGIIAEDEYVVLIYQS